MHESRLRHFHRAFATLLIFTLAAGDFWRYLIGWWGWGALVLALLVTSLVLVVRARFARSWLPPTLVAFLVLAALSIAWSAYPAASALGVAATVATTVAGAFLALGMAWRDFVDSLASALRWVLGLSLAFELFVSTVIRAPVLPFWVDYSELATIPRAFYWSRDLLFEGGRIQGIVGNANLLGMIALLSLAVSLVVGATTRHRLAWNAIWAAVAVITLALTRSSTVLASAIGVVLLLALVLLVRRVRGRARVMVQAGGALALLGFGAAVLAAHEPILALLSKSTDLTNRGDIWGAVLGLIEQRPVAGWGWISYWAPWVAPFDDLAVVRGVTYLQAHNAWLDVTLQLGVIGLVIFAAFVAGTFLRVWLTAIDPSSAPTRALLPLALLVALLVQSLAESRLLVELGWALLVVLSLYSAGASQAPRSPLRAEPRT